VALEAAIRFEMRVRDLYRKASDLAPSLATKNMLIELAHEEHEHLETLRRAYAHLEKTGKLKKFESENPPVAPDFEDEIRKMTELLSETAADHRTVEHLRAVEKAEREAYGYFHKLSDRLQGKQHIFFQRFLEMEKTHVVSIQERIRQTKSFVSVPPK
jgi:rubrerythrin